MLAQRDTDSAIIALFFARDESAIKRTGERYGALLLSLAENITGSHTDAEECLNDAYLALWQAIPPERPNNFRAYLCRVIRNIASTRFRANNAAKRRGDLVPFDDELAEMIPNGATEGDASGLSEAINTYLRSLSPSDRLIFVRRYFFSDPIETISARTGIGANTVTTRLYRMRERLREYLEKEGYAV